MASEEQKENLRSEAGEALFAYDAGKLDTEDFLDKIEKIYRSEEQKAGGGERPIYGAIYLRAISVANRGHQVVGEKSDLYVTIAQLEAILREVKREHDEP